jgi:dTDP-4-dehydrorhamnose reductase
MTDIQILGANGMLGSALMRELSDTGPVPGPRDVVDVREPDQLRDFVKPHAIVINASAFTQVDAAETDVENAFSVNAEGVKNLAVVAKDKNARVIHISTDYVFDGKADTPYAEDAPPAPRSVYGASKLAGEQHLQTLLPEHSVILRTAWLYGYPGSCFPNTILTASANRETLQVVTDQVGQPTWTGDVARMVRLIIDAPDVTGIFHATNSGQASWWEFARRLFELAHLDPNRIEPATTESFVRLAPRPSWSVLSHQGWATHGFPTPRHWREALDEAWETELHALVPRGSDS